MRNHDKSRNKVASKKLAPPNYLIICEGKETEPNYFNGLKQKINEKFGDRISIVPAIKIKGTGLNTESLVKYTKQYINKSPKVYGQVWVVTTPLSKNNTLKELKKEFQNADLGNYSKNDKEIFERVTKDNRLESAIKNCKEIYEEFNCVSSNASKNPCTTVFMLVEDLSEYLK